MEINKIKTMKKKKEKINETKVILLKDQQSWQTSQEKKREDSNK